MVSHISTTQPLFSFTTSHTSLVKISQLANQGFSFLGVFLAFAAILFDLVYNLCVTLIYLNISRFTWQHKVFD